MKVKQLKKMLSVTMAAAMLTTSMPVGTYANDVFPTEIAAEEELSTSVENAVEETSTLTENTATDDWESSVGEELEALTDGAVEVESEPSTENSMEREPETMADNTNVMDAETEITDIPQDSTLGMDSMDTVPSTSKTQTVMWGITDGAILVWNGKNQAPAADAGDAVVTLSYMKDGVPITENEVVEPGSYAVTANADDPNVLLDDATRTFTITKQSAMLEWASSEAIYTGEKVPFPKASFIDIEGNEVLLDVTCAENVDVIDVGQYKLKATLTEEQQEAGYGTHYDIQNLETEFEFTVEPCPVSIVWGSSTAVYNGKVQNLSYRVNCECHTFEAAKISVTYKDSEGKEVAEPIEVGTYTATAKINGDANHVIKPGEEKSDLTINKYGVIISPVKTDKEYDGEKTQLGYTLTITDSSVTERNVRDILGDYPLTYGDDESAGTYKITLTDDAQKKVDEANFIVQVDPDAVFTITPCQVNLKWENVTVTYDKDVHSLKPTWDPKKYAGLREGDIIVSYSKDGVTVKEDELTDVGTYMATAEIINKNYKLSLGQQSGTLRIVKLPITITVDPDQEKYYGAEDPDLTYKVSGLPKNSKVTEDDVRAELGETPLKRTEGENAGRYRIAFATDPMNYNVTYKSAYFVIKKLPITITAEKGQRKFYNTEIGSESYEYSVEATEATKLTNEQIIAELRKEFHLSENAEFLTRKKAGEGKAPEEIGEYTLRLVFEKERSHNYEISYTEEKYYIIDPFLVVIKAANLEKFYGEADLETLGMSYTIAVEKEGMTPEQEQGLITDIQAAIGKALKDKGQDFLLYCEDGVDAGKYSIKFNLTEKDLPKYNIQFAEGCLTIKRLPITITGERDTIYYGQRKPNYHFSFTISDEVPIINIVKKDSEIKADIAAALTWEKSGAEFDPVGEYAYMLNEEVARSLTNYTVTLDTENSEKIKIVPLPITITADPGQGKFYSGANSKLNHTTSIRFNEMTVTQDEMAITIDRVDAELARISSLEWQLLTREDGENAGEYLMSLAFDPKSAINYNIIFEGDVYTIYPIPVTITPNEMQEKIFGQKEPEYYGYTASITMDKTNLTNEQVMAELGNYVLQREAGEAIGSYRYNLITEDSIHYAETHFRNFILTISDKAPVFTINPVVITEIQSIDSRQSSFRVATNITGERQPDVITKFKVEAINYPTSVDGIVFSTRIDDYIQDATDGIVFTQDAGTITIKTAEYRKEKKDNSGLLQWNGYLPAGTTIQVSAVDESGNAVSVEPVTMTVVPVSVQMNWSGYETNSSVGNYVTANNGVPAPLTLVGSKADEWIEFIYDGMAPAYEMLNFTFTPSVKNVDSSHMMQSVTANIVDTLNLVCESQSLQFYVDDNAFTIPSSAIQFENRGQNITVRLPEMGTLTSVTIEGATVEVPGDVSQEFSLPVRWSGRNLIPTGASISVVYTDQAGHQGTGTATVTQSSVTTPITFRIRPELNANGYLNGRSNNLIVSGTACTCEPIRVTVAGMSQTINAAQADAWSDSNGSWEILFDMGTLPEGQDFEISAEYMDVSGTGYSMMARFDAFCASPSTVSPIYEAMTYISGMVEPGTAVALVVNGDSQNYYEIDVDRFGHFVMDDVPMMFAGEDSFDIYVTDIAGNVSIRHYEIEEPGDPFEVTSKVNPLGKFFYSAQENDSITHVATPVSAADFKEEEDSIEVPLLMGMSYEVGTLTLARTENGFTVSSEIQISEDIDPEDYRFENEKLYVYTSRPTLDDLKNNTGTEIVYGEEIALAEDATVWIVDERDMTILADDMMDLELFDFENSEEYAKYQGK